MPSLRRLARAASANRWLLRGLLTPPRRQARRQERLRIRRGIVWRDARAFDARRAISRLPRLPPRRLHPRSLTCPPSSAKSRTASTASKTGSFASNSAAKRAPSPKRTTPASAPAPSRSCANSCEGSRRRANWFLHSIARKIGARWGPLRNTRAPRTGPRIRRLRQTLRPALRPARRFSLHRARRMRRAGWPQWLRQNHSAESRGPADSPVRGPRAVFLT